MLSIFILFLGKISTTLRIQTVWIFPDDFNRSL